MEDNGHKAEGETDGGYNVIAIAFCDTFASEVRAGSFTVVRDTLRRYYQ